MSSIVYSCRRFLEKQRSHIQVEAVWEDGGAMNTETALSYEIITTGWHGVTSQKNEICMVLFSYPPFCFSFSSS
jgi:hypothetical protein